MWEVRVRGGGQYGQTTKSRSLESTEPAASPLGPPVAFDPAAIDVLLSGRQTMAELDERFCQMKKALMERALAGELTHHLDSANGAPKPAEQPNHRTGTAPKTVPTEDGEAALPAFAASPEGQRYPTIAPRWRRPWAYVTPAFAYPPAIRRILTTTNAIESVHSQWPKIIKTRGHSPTDEAALQLLDLALRNIAKRWHPAPTWVAALTHFAVLFPNRFIPEPRST